MDLGVCVRHYANLNYNTDFEDMCIMREEWFIKSSVLSMVSDSISVYGEEEILSNRLYR